MFFLGSEQRARHAFIDASLQNTFEQLSDPALGAQLGEGLAGDHARLLQKGLYIPNVRHGMLRLPRSIDDNRVPVVALAVGEEMQVDPRAHKMTPVQSDRVAQSLIQWANSEEDYRQDMAKLRNGPPDVEPLLLTADGSALAMVVSSVNFFTVDSPKAGKFNKRGIFGRPVVSLTYNSDEPRLEPSVIGHELEHVLQHLFEPIKKAKCETDWRDITLRNELEAYQVQGSYMLGLARKGYQPMDGEKLTYRAEDDGTVYSTVAAINNLRHKTNAGRKDKFFPNGTLRKMLEEVGLDIL